MHVKQLLLANSSMLFETIFKSFPKYVYRKWLSYEISYSFRVFSITNMKEHVGYLIANHCRQFNVFKN